MKSRSKNARAERLHILPVFPLLLKASASQIRRSTSLLTGTYRPLSLNAAWQERPSTKACENSVRHSNAGPMRLLLLPVVFRDLLRLLPLVLQIAHSVAGQIVERLPAHSESNPA